MSYLEDENPYTIEEFTIEETYDMLKNNLIELNPIFQRGEIAPKNWMIDVIQAIWRRSSINSFHFRKLPHPCVYRYQVLDGLQRLTSIINYMSNNIPVHTNKKTPVYLPYEDNYVEGYWFDLRKDKKNIFLNRKITVTVYSEKMTNTEAAIVFGNINNNNKLSDQEIRNAIIGYISDAVRQTVNPHEEEENRKHPLFEILALKNDRRQIEEAYAKMFQYEYNQSEEGNFNAYVVSDSSLWEMYREARGQTDKKLADKISKISHRRLSMLKEIYDFTEPRLRKAVFGKASKLVFHYCFLLFIESKYTIEDIKEFAKKYTETFFLLYNDTETLYDGKQRSRSQVIFKNYVGLKFIEQVDFKMNLMLEAIKGEGLSRKPELDEDRYFPLHMQYERWLEVGKICEHSRKKTEFDDIVGGHIIPHSRGGKTVYENLMVIDKKINLKMGNMTPEEFRAKEEKKAAA